jgi:hypothetical protein
MIFILTLNITIWNNFVTWLEKHMGSCIYKRFLGIECPGCGMQRSIIELLKGHFAESFQIYPALLPLFFTLFFLVLHLIFKFKQGALILKISFIFTALTMIVAYILKFTI